MKRAKRSGLTLCIFILSAGIIFSLVVHAQTRGNPITIMYTNSLNGTLEACLCVSNPNGGLEKRGYAVTQLRKQYPDALLLDSGDISSYFPDELLMEYVIKGFRHIGYTAVGIGDQEFAAGTETFHRHKGQLLFLCANLQYYADGSWHQPQTNMTVNGNNSVVAITAIIDEDAFKYYPKDVLSKIKISDPVTALRREIKKLEKADFIIVISHSGFDKDKEIAAAVPGIGLIIGGHSQTLVQKPLRVGNTLIVQAGAGGARIGVITAAVQNGYARSFKNKFILPDYDDKSDRVIHALIQEYNKAAAQGSRR